MWDIHERMALSEQTSEEAGRPSRAAPRVAGLLLAAGGGRRLGGRPKALLSHRGRPLVEHAVRALREGGCDPVYVVLGAAGEQVRGTARLNGCVLVDNANWPEGMGTSLRAGLDALRTGAGAARAGGAGAAGAGPGGQRAAEEAAADAVVISLVDQPAVGPAAVARVRTAYRSRATLASAAYHGRRGHPVLLGAAHWQGVADAARADSGARVYLRKRADELTLVECADIADPADIDTPADLRRLD
jgi:nicotine blue oxidoreductase